MVKILSRDGTEIAFWRSGTGPSLLLVHGTTADHTRWSSISARLEEHFTVYAMDRRGRGGSGDSADYHLLREGEDVAAVVEAIDGPVFLLGHSYGAVCSLEGALLADGVHRLILYEPPIPAGQPPYPPGAPERMQALVDKGELEAALEIMFREIVRMPQHEFDVYSRLPMWQRRIAMAPTIPREVTLDRTYRFAPEKFATMTTPTLLLLGGDSPPLVRRQTEMVDAALPNSRVAVMPGQQHVAMDLAPALFVEQVISFLLQPAARNIQQPAASQPS